MYMLTVTIAATNTAQRIVGKSPIIDNSNTAFQNLLPYNSGTHVMYIGDVTLTGAANGIPLQPSGSLAAILAISESSDLKDFYIYGTANDVLIIMVFP
jgi:hypothetical protein